MASAEISSSIIVCHPDSWCLGLLDSGAALAEIGVHHFFPFSLGFQDELYGIAEGAVASRMGCHVMGLFLHFGASILHRDGQAAGAHSGKIDDVVTDKGRFLQPDSRLLDDFFEGSLLILNTLKDIFQFKVAGAERNGLRDALGDQTSLNAGQTG